MLSMPMETLSSSASNVFLIAPVDFHVFVLEISFPLTLYAHVIVYIQPSRLVRSEIANTIKLTFTFGLFSDTAYADKLLAHARTLYNFAHKYRGAFKTATETPK